METHTLEEAARQVALAVERSRELRGVGNLLVDLVRKRKPDEHQTIAAMFAARTTSVLEVVQLLTEHGHQGEAWASTRTICELDIDLAYILKADTPRRMRLFWNHRHLRDHRRIADLVKSGGTNYPPEVLRNIAKNADRVRKDYKGHEDRWCKPSIEERAKATGRFDPYVLAYSFGSGALHSGAETLTYGQTMIPRDDDEGFHVDLQVGAKKMDPVPLACALTLTLYVLDNVNTFCKLGCERNLVKFYRALDQQPI